MKRIITILAAGAALLLTGCATDMTAYYKAMEKIAEADNNAVMGLAAAAQRGSEGAVVALAVRKSMAGQITPPQDKALQWASILIPGLTNAYAINRNTTVQLANIEAETAQYGATLGTIGAISIKGMEEAGKVVFPPVYTVPMGSAPAEAAPIAPATPVAETPAVTP